MGNDARRPIRELVWMSRAVGRDPRLVQAGGGNTSIKSADGATLWVKASGTALREMSSRKGYRKLRLPAVLDILHDPALPRKPPVERDAEVGRRLLAACEDSLPGHPSVETPLHAFLGRCVVHAHPTATNGLLCAREGRQVILDLFRDMTPPILYIGWRNPGLTLARSTYLAVRRFVAEHGPLPRLIFLQNHGLFASGEDAREAARLVKQVEDRVRAEWRRRRPRQEVLASGPVLTGDARRRLILRTRGILREVWSRWMPGRLIVGFTQAGAVREIVRRPDAPALLRAGALTPDQLAYAHGAPLWADVDDLGQRGTAGSLRRQLDRAMRMQVGPPRAVAARGLGLFVVEQSPRLLRMAQEMTLASLESLRVAADFGGPRGLSRNAASYIEGWPYEEFRRAVAARGRAEGLLRSAGR